MSGIGGASERKAEEPEKKSMPKVDMRARSGSLGLVEKRRRSSSGWGSSCSWETGGSFCERLTSGSMKPARGGMGGVGSGSDVS
jgi:hypothetical protein